MDVSKSFHDNVDRLLESSTAEGNSLSINSVSVFLSWSKIMIRFKLGWVLAQNLFYNLSLRCPPFEPAILLIKLKENAMFGEA